MIDVTQAETPEQIEEARRLFREYERWLALDLCFQNFEEELKNLPGNYAAPNGRLFLIRVNNAVAGCAALRKLEERICEMKRLFVRENFRGLNLGKILIEKLLTEARFIGYEKMRLDTLPEKMPRAVKLYQSVGFYKIAPYYENPHRETLFLELDLTKTNL
jgi:ribosomal protein S18 acetylase RimI-like enzyme